ncbi:MAG: NAD-dependent epimerase/dehydratase family protein [Paracoccaceae bacterium]|nr:NAD-dependent epimerase/dehydratase family protein [Paracoccaceae bacterium]
MDREVIPVIGYGPVGREVTAQLTEKGYGVLVIQRRPPTVLPEGARFAEGDVMDAGGLVSAIGAARTVILAIGIPYDGKLWARDWPRAMASTLDACERLGARLVFVDNLYLYGPQDRPLTEDMPPVDYGVKPKARAEVTRLWQRAAEDGRVKTAAVRAPDFYGPGVQASILGFATIGNLAAGKPAQVIASADYPHDVAHVRDFARAVVTLAEAPDEDFNQAWHVPTAPTQTMRELLTIAAEALGVPMKITVLPQWLAPIMQIFIPYIREARDMHFLFDRPYVVDSRKFAKRFWSDATPLEDGIAETARFFARE